MTDLQPMQPANPRSKRIYVMWSAAMGVLVLVGVFCWMFLSPYLQVRAALDRWETYGSFTADLQRKEIERLGEPEAAAREAR